MIQETGIQARLLHLLDSAGDDEVKVKEIISAYSRLVHFEQMGSSYKVLGFSPKGTMLTGFPSRDESEQESENKWQGQAPK